MGDRDERGVADLDHDPGHRAVGDLGRDLPGQAGDLRRHLGPVGEVALVGDLAAVRARDVRGRVDRRPRRGRCRAGPATGRSWGRTPWRGPSGSAAASCRTVVMPSAASLATVFAPIPQIASGGRSPRTSNQVAVVSRQTPAGLPKPVAILACSLLSPMPTEQSRPVAALTSAARPRAKPSGSSVADADERLVPAEDLDRAAGLPQHGHDPGRDLVVRVGVHRQEDAVRAALRRGAQRQAGVHAELARLVGGGGDDAALRRVAVPADHDRLAAQLGVAQLLDGGEELVQVHVQHPLGHAGGLTQPARP